MFFISAGTHLFNKRFIGYSSLRKVNSFSLQVKMVTIFTILVFKLTAIVVMNDKSFINISKTLFNCLSFCLLMQVFVFNSKRGLSANYIICPFIVLNTVLSCFRLFISWVNTENNWSFGELVSCCVLLFIASVSPNDYQDHQLTDRLIPYGS